MWDRLMRLGKNRERMGHRASYKAASGPPYCLSHREAGRSVGGRQRLLLLDQLHGQEVGRNCPPNWTLKEPVVTYLSLIHI